MLAYRSACLLVAGITLYCGTGAFAQTADFRKSAVNAKDQRKSHDLGSDECQRAKQALFAEAGKSTTKTVSVYSIRDIAAMECSQAIVLAHLFTDFKSDSQLSWEAFKESQEHQQAEFDVAQAQKRQLWQQNFVKQMEDIRRGFEPRQQPALSPPRFFPPRLPQPRLEGPRQSGKDPGWLQQEFESAWRIYGKPGQQQDGQMNWNGFSGADDDSVEDTGPLGGWGGPAVGSEVHDPYLPAESKTDAKVRRDSEVERRKENWAREKREEAKARDASDEKHAKANGDKMRELLGESEGLVSDSLNEPIADTMQSEAGVASQVETQAQSSSDTLTELLGSTGSGSSTSDLVNDLLEQVKPSDFNHSSPYGTTAGAIGPSTHVYKNTLDAKPPEGLRVVSTYSLNDGMKAAVYSGNFQGTDVVYVAWAGTEDRKDWATNFEAYAKLFAQSGDDNSDIPSQFKHAVELAKQVQAINPGKEIILTGHSLGGMLAAFTSDRTGLPAVVFNSAGTERMIQAGKKARGDRTPSRVAHVNATGDILTQNPYVAFFGGRPWSTDVKMVQSPSPGVNVANHFLGPMADSIRTGTPMLSSDERSKEGPWHFLYLDSAGVPR